MPKGVPYFFRENFSLCTTVRHSEYLILHTHSNGPSHLGGEKPLKEPRGKDTGNTQKKVPTKRDLSNIQTLRTSEIFIPPT